MVGSTASSRRTAARGGPQGRASDGLAELGGTVTLAPARGVTWELSTTAFMANAVPVSR